MRLLGIGPRPWPDSAACPIASFSGVVHSRNHAEQPYAEVHRRPRRGSAGTLACLRSRGSGVLRRRALASRGTAPVSRCATTPPGGTLSERRIGPSRAPLARCSGRRRSLNGRSSSASGDSRIGTGWLRTRTAAWISSGLSQCRREATDLRLSRRSSPRHTRSAPGRARRRAHSRRPTCSGLSSEVCSSLARRPPPGRRAAGRRRRTAYCPDARCSSGSAVAVRVTLRAMM